MIGNQYKTTTLILLVSFFLGGCWGRKFFHMPSETLSVSHKVDSLLAVNVALQNRLDEIEKKLAEQEDFTRSSRAQLKLELEQVLDEINAMREMMRQEGLPFSRKRERVKEREVSRRDTLSQTGIIPDTLKGTTSDTGKFVNNVTSKDTTGRSITSPESVLQHEKVPGVKAEKSTPDTTNFSGKKIPEPEELYRQAYLYFNRGNYELAIEELDIFIKNYPDDPLYESALFLKGESFFEKGDYFDAIKQFSMILSSFPRGKNVPGALLRMALAYEKVGDHDMAIVIARRLIREYPYTDESAVAKDHVKELD